MRINYNRGHRDVDPTSEQRAGTPASAARRHDTIPVHPAAIERPHPLRCRSLIISFQKVNVKNERERNKRSKERRRQP